MTKVINCECGYVVRGESDDDLLANAHEHIRSDHPDMVGQVTDAQLLEMAQEQPATA
jgi:predicted small metal-binding protein